MFFSYNFTPFKYITFDKIFKRTNPTADECKPIKDTSSTVTANISAFTTTLAGYTQITSLNVGSTTNIITGSTLTNLLTDGAKSHAVTALNTAIVSSNYYQPWKCPSGCSTTTAFTAGPTITADSLPVSISTGINAAITAGTSAYLARGSTTSLCPGKTKYLYPDKTESCSDYPFPSENLTAIKTDVNTSIKAYIEGNTFQVNRSITCTTGANYTPTYMKPSALTGGLSVYPIQDTVTTQSNRYYNGILIKISPGATMPTYTIIANEVGIEHVRALHKAQTPVT